MSFKSPMGEHPVCADFSAAHYKKVHKQQQGYFHPAYAGEDS